MARFAPSAESPHYVNEHGKPAAPSDPGARLVNLPGPRYLERNPDWWPTTPVATPEERAAWVAWKARSLF